MYTVAWIIAIMFFIGVLYVGINILEGKRKANFIEVIILILFIVMVICFAGHASKQDTMIKAAYNEGYQAGYADRDKESNSTAYEAGHEAGLEEGRVAADATSYNRGYETGETTGYNRGYTDGANWAIENAQLIEVTQEGYAIMFEYEDNVHEYDWDW